MTNRIIRTMPADFSEAARGMTVNAAARRWNTNFLVVRRWFSEAGIKPISAEERIEHCRRVPDDFAKWAPIESNNALRKRYRTNAGPIVRWREETGIPAPSPAPTRRPVPEGFQGMAATMTRHQLALHFGCGDETVKRWARETGTALRNGRPRGGFGALKSYALDARDSSTHSRAQSHLQRYGPVYRCDQRGQASPKGAFFYVWGAILNPDEMLSRAKRKGFDEREWARVAA